MPTVEKVELYHVRVPLPATFHPSWIPGFPQKQNRFDLLRVIDSDGVEGFAAGPAMARERDGLGQLLGPYLIGEDATDLSLVKQRLREMGYLGWRNAWIEHAFWDLAGKRAGKPAYALLAPELAGKPITVKLYASTGEVKEPAARIDECEARLAEGFDTVKLRVHDFDETKDVAHVTQVARALGGRMKLGVDANQGWRVSAIADAPRWDLPRAQRFAQACADAGIAWIEEPLPMDGYDDLAALTRSSTVPIAGGELHTGGLPELSMMIEKRCYSIFQPDCCFSGGMADTLEVARRCRAAGLMFTPHTWTNGFGFAANLHVFAASGYAAEKALEYPYNPPSWTVAARDGILREPFVHTRGSLTVPARPGLGVEVDWAALSRYGKRVFVMDKKRLVLFGLLDRGLSAAREIDAARKARRAAARR
ncbi:MAG: mandelate racemase/muconate lactonizing enzyme family protein [Deltaproteobacteria bacterium]|nr:mandelate racemase/muconate lactonizing enzyme family protein [Deltaproteobacteria bacterium]